VSFEHSASRNNFRFNLLCHRNQPDPVPQRLKPISSSVLPQA
jgi:hypothetical protein